MHSADNVDFMTLTWRNDHQQALLQSQMSKQWGAHSFSLLICDWMTYLQRKQGILLTVHQLKNERDIW